MTTTELKKLAEAATPGPWMAAGPSFGGEFPVYCDEVVVDREHDDDDGYGICQASTGLEKESTHDMSYIAAANPAAILKLLAINAELVEALRSMLSLVRHNAPELSGKVLGDAEAALAKAEGGEL